MRVLEISPQRLVLEDRPMVLGIILAVVIVLLAFLALVTARESGWIALALTLMAALFAGAFVLFVRKVTVIFDREVGVVVIASKSVMGQKESSRPLSDLARASVETSISRSTSSNGGRATTSRTHRTVLHFGDETVPLTLVFSGGDRADRAARAINDWLGQPDDKPVEPR